jgi:tetratricopeptide (TPR) repeat protein
LTLAETRCNFDNEIITPQMPSIIEGYNYDIFISYRQKDNKYDGWVSEFVENLKKELEATFKEEISVYFDINPHDGLLETHDVDESLKEKLKCLIFIPIISRTYCDPKSFAWEHEFKAFVEMASCDQFGLKVKLLNANVASRVLPIRIHYLDPADIRECESVLDGVLRGIEFIYKETGIDKPLAPTDNEKKNLSNTTYRIQIIKVAHAIKEIILGIKKEPSQEVKEKDQLKESFKKVRQEESKINLEKHVKSNKVRFLISAAFIALLIITGIITYPKIFKRDTLKKLRSSGEKISIAVMPFQNMTNDTIWNVWQDGIQDMLITSLSDSHEDLIVRQAEPINNILQIKGLTNYASITPSIAGTISQSLDADVFIYGNIKQAGSAIRLYAQLIDSKTKEVFKSFQIEGAAREEEIFQIVDSVGQLVRNFLIISLLDNEIPVIYRYSKLTNSPEAYRYFLYGNKSFIKRDFPAARNWYQQAVDIDSNLTTAAFYISVSYANQGLYEQGKEWSLRLYEKRNLMSPRQKVTTNWLNAFYFGTPYDEIKYLEQSLEMQDYGVLEYFILGNKYSQLNQYDKAILAYEKSIKLSDNWRTKPLWIFSYTYLGKAYHNTGQYNKEKKLYKKAEQDFPDDPELLYNQAVLELYEGKIEAADKHIEKYKSVRKDQLWSEASTINEVANIFLDADILDKAEEYYRKALSMEPENPTRMNNLAYFLIDKDRNLNEGLELVDKVQKISPDSHLYLDTKGWGLYKKGSYLEALKILQKADSIKPIYNHAIYLHLEAAKKAVASQMNN